MTDYTEIYFHNVYEVVLSPTSTFSFSLQKLYNHHIFDRPFGIITAGNPENRTLSDDENRSRNLLLYKDLNSYEILQAKGCYEGHCEEGYLVFDISLEMLFALGRKYKQYAVFYNDTKSLSYMECESEAVVVRKKRDA